MRLFCAAKSVMPICSRYCCFVSLCSVQNHTMHNGKLKSMISESSLLSPPRAGGGGNKATVDD